jgi:hypothetical protein
MEIPSPNNRSAGQDNKHRMILHEMFFHFHSSSKGVKNEDERILNRESLCVCFGMYYGLIN